MCGGLVIWRQHVALVYGADGGAFTFDVGTCSETLYLVSRVVAWLCGVVFVLLCRSAAFGGGVELLTCCVAGGLEGERACLVRGRVF